MDEATTRVWLELDRRWHTVNPDRYEYLVEARLPRDQEWSIGHSPEHELAEGTGPRGWWLARFSGCLSPVTNTPEY